MRSTKPLQNDERDFKPRRGDRILSGLRHLFTRAHLLQGLRAPLRYALHRLPVLCRPFGAYVAPVIVRADRFATLLSEGLGEVVCPYSWVFVATGLLQ